MKTQQEMYQAIQTTLNEISAKLRAIGDAVKGPEVRVVDHKQSFKRYFEHKKREAQKEANLPKLTSYQDFVARQSYLASGLDTIESWDKVHPREKLGWWRAAEASLRALLGDRVAAAILAQKEEYIQVKLPSFSKEVNPIKFSIY